MIRLPTLETGVNAIASRGVTFFRSLRDHFSDGDDGAALDVVAALASEAEQNAGRGWGPGWRGILFRSILAAVVVLQGEISCAQGTASEREVMVTIFYLKCVMCHGRRQQDGGLDVRTRAALLKGGVSGPAIVPGKPDDSLLIQRIVSEQMHPNLKLLEDYLTRPVTSSELETLRKWIAAGAPAGDEILEVPSGGDPLVSDEDREFWSFVPPEWPPVPNVPEELRQFVRTPIDAFVLEKLAGKGIGFSPEAGRLTLMRRAYLDLVGLPPTPEEVQEYLKDENPLAYERLIDRLLASPHYGERWGKYWLDAVGYADTEGHSSDNPVRKEGYRYRDYVIRSFNADKPYNQFLLEQIAGDELFDYRSVKELTPEQLDYLVATGFLRTAADGTSVHLAQEIFGERFGVIIDQVNILSSAVLGLTMDCARCHDHKYDSIPTRDYYRFSAILRTAYDPYDWLDPTIEGRSGAKDPFKRVLRYLPHADERWRRELEAHNAPIEGEIKRLEQSLEEAAQPLRKQIVEQKLEKLPEEVRDDLRKVLEIAEEQRNEEQNALVKKFGDSLKVEQQELEDQFESFKEQAERTNQSIHEAQEKLRPVPQIRALFDMGGESTPTHILLGGDFQHPGPQVEPGVPSALSTGVAPYRVVKPSWDTSGRRLALAQWLIQPNHPLTGRVMVNRIWQDHFGQGLVATPDNFGVTGTTPSHPELLDWLALEFVRQGWSVKQVHRLIMTSTVYRQSSRIDDVHRAADPDNTFLSRFPLRRMDAETIRDSILHVAGRLITTQFGPADEMEAQPDGEVVSKSTTAGGRRSVYLLQPRPKWEGAKAPPTLLETFDVQPLRPNCLKRARSTVSSQALQLMNSHMVRDNSRHFAQRVVDAVGMDQEQQIKQIYLIALSRWPSEDELRESGEVLRALNEHWLAHREQQAPGEPNADQARSLALATFCHTILNSPEFIYID